MLRFFCLLFLASCASTPDRAPEAPVAAEKPYPIMDEVLRDGMVKHDDPLPNEYRFRFRRTYNTGKAQEYLKYRGWDVDKDGHIDMLEVLDENGAEQAFVFDFDYDGKVDLIRRKNE